jgi:hypothetical protein
MQKKKKEPWRIGAFLAGAAAIVWMFAKKGITITLATLPREQALPIIVTTVAVSLLKVALLAGVLLLAKWLLGNLRK